MGGAEEATRDTLCVSANSGALSVIELDKFIRINLLTRISR